MKYFNKIFDIFLFEGIFVLLFSSILLLLDDRHASLFFTIAIVSILIAVILGATGYFFNLFKQENSFEES